MNTDMLIDYFLQMNDDEIFYKQYKEAAKDPKTFTTFLSQVDLDDIRKRKLMLPELLPDSVPAYLPEAEYFGLSDSCNVGLFKHNRYTPPYEHTHYFFEIIYVLKGTCEHHILQKNMPLKEGDLCLISPSIAHSISVMEQDTIVLNILMRKSTIEDIFFNVLRSNSIISNFFLNSIYSKQYSAYLLFPIANDDELRNLILEMYLEQFEEDEYSDRIISSMLTIFFTKLIRKHKKTVEVSEDFKASQNALLSFILDHYDSVTLKMLAEHLNYSVSYCSRYVKNCTGYSFSQLLKKIRFQKAETFLLSTNMSIHNISIKLGYDDPENFMRAFKKEYGMTPSEYRMNHSRLTQ